MSSAQPSPGSSRTILVCDDEELIRWSICEHLDQAGYRTIQAADGEECLALLRSQAPSLVLLDLKMPRLGGLDVLQRLREAGDDIPVIVITAHGGVESAIEATRLGASGYVTKPFDLREVALQVDRTLSSDALRLEVDYLRHRDRSGYGEFLGTSPQLKPLFETLERLEGVDAPTVLITGESGTGKDVIARSIHAKGRRRGGVFMEIDCASLPEQLIESELFGHERGAFTDAKTTKRGLFEVAGGGVVFLDEIGEMSLATQAKLLRALESRSFKRVGGVAGIPLNAAVIAATNRDLRQSVQRGEFREDLFFRLNVIPLHIPPLRDRAEDVPILIAHFLDRFARQLGRNLDEVSRPAMAMLQAYPWPGNVRELRNVLERIVLLGRGAVLRPEDLPHEVRFAQTGSGDHPTPFTLPAEGIRLDEVEQSLVRQALERTGGNQSAAARLLGISRYALRYRMAKYAAHPNFAGSGRPFPER